MIIDGKKVSAERREFLKEQIQEFKQKTNITPKLVAIIVGDDSASEIYVKSKSKACDSVGIASDVIKLHETTTQQQLLERIHGLNKDKNTHAILVQLPLPNHINKDAIINAIDVNKDVDGFHPENIGKLQANIDCIEPCTPKGVITLLNSYNIDIKGANAVVVGASNIVGKPISQMLLRENATVTTCHIHTKNLASHTKNADILVVAIGKAKFIKANMIKDNAVVIDVGINRLENKKICGDVDFDNTKDKVKAITPVPGGVGPMTITELLYNTFECCKKSSN